MHGAAFSRILRQLCGHFCRSLRVLDFYRDREGAPEQRQLPEFHKGEMLSANLRKQRSSAP
ncbi:hypothetical protein SAMN04488047_12311 [Tranquillimonas alkanivorans]|uniref:Uncharacterized protein n=1 Tax=Tranquillimonas alkanivorans TaxID=441119 RepID=A0A1I5UR45_9RHOB|nr:hypothetical protein SAMN04488047_12311 [Tranquillimonas alkanivorans]